jgi:hypothetical protein
VSTTIVKNAGRLMLATIASVVHFIVVLSAMVLSAMCELCGINGTDGIPVTLSKHSAKQDEVRSCETVDGGNHPWHGLDFDDGILSQF